MESKEQLAGIMTSETRPKFYSRGDSIEDMASIKSNKEAGVLFSTSVKTLTTVDSQNQTSRSASINSTESSDTGKRIRF